ncbi:flagellin [Halanaerobium salsuginis]|uniref:Flagellin n=1 Tax=Halanaerobium salsuginis TaxID=29563 RepID=A0A1I4FWL5_9FIRM|nr:flagellin [Halanaerobium salsuginis]SFL22225.1 flagellin [Halanaerobium salsuginis]
MRINTNVAALNSYNQLKNTQGNLQKSLQRLSSGKRINGAADDAAGLAISEKMNAQTRGLAQAQRNAQDGISMIQTAEGALKETHSILQRMRELSVQAANDTNTSDDRAEIQKEISQLTSEIDRISNTTEFNTKSLLNGDLSFESTLTAGSTNISEAEAVDNSLTTQTYGIETTSVSRTTANVTGKASDGVSIAATNSAELGENTVKLESATDGTSAFDAVLYDAEGNELARNINQSAGATATVGGVTIDNTGDGTNYAQGDEVTFDAQMTATFEVTDQAGDTVGNTVTVTDDTSGEVNVGGFKLSFDAELAAAADATIDFDDEKAARFQIGANSGQATKMSVSDMSASALQIDNLDLTDQSGASSAINTLDDAIKYVSAERSKLGAAQNRLDHTINNLNTAEENLTAAESRISDVDMAKEMMSFTKSQILSQAGTAMMAQANQLPQGVLQLLG